MVVAKKVEHSKISVKCPNVKVRVNGKTAALVDSYCEEQHITRSALIREALFYYLQMKEETKDTILTVDRIDQNKVTLLSYYLKINRLTVPLSMITQDIKIGDCIDIDCDWINDDDFVFNKEVNPLHEIKEHIAEYDRLIQLIIKYIL